jgi:hypothetical protein
MLEEEENEDDYRGSNYAYEDLFDVDVINENLEGSNFAFADLSAANFFMTWMPCSNFAEADLFSSNMEQATLFGSNFHGANLQGANFAQADLSMSNLSFTQLNRANFENTKLSHANLLYAKMYGANLEGADLSYSNLSHTMLTNTNLKGANLYGVNIDRTVFNNATWDRETVWPEGFYFGSLNTRCMPDEKEIVEPDKYEILDSIKLEPVARKVLKAAIDFQLFGSELEDNFSPDFVTDFKRLSPSISYEEYLGGYESSERDWLKILINEFNFHPEYEGILFESLIAKKEQTTSLNSLTIQDWAELINQTKSWAVNVVE